MSAGYIGPIKGIAEGIFDGPHATPTPSDEGPVFLGVANVTPDGRLDLTNPKRISLQDFPKWTRRVQPQENDIVFSYEATLHRYARIPAGFHGCLGRRMALIRPDTSKVDPRYLHLYLLTSKWRQIVESNVISGATVDRIPLVKFPDFPVVLPELRVQRDIADHLVLYDDLIENNRRRIKLLEEAARLIYREWFVRLRFPGHEITKIEHGIPEGWSEKPIESALESHIGGGWGQDDPLEQEIEPAYVIRGTDFPALAQGEFGKVGLRYHKPGPLTKRILSAGDIVFEVSGGSATQPIARTVYMTDRLISAFSAPIICASFCKKFRPLSHELGLYLHLTFKEDRENGKLLIYQKQSASALLNYNFEAFLSGYRVRIPSESVLYEFFQSVFPLLDQCTVLAMQNKKLSQARDLLLPRLMSGEIEV